ncbi:hypothetical protein [Methylobacterium planeticum]|uniref:Uncharacterized protein n=1 Tax=Methylobacterium planeticum TaxID=2615211 RepID=A0A6N6MUZ8_9HYPH|nr:hypothetical protein [Methylobacterium planeticum]KAB1072677.1 hypothetical protein F6X51_15445 [Methylobacterium planeticum]
MRVEAWFVPAEAAAARPLAGALPRRGILILVSLLAVAGAATLGQPAEAEPDLLRLLRFMALLKGVFALAALAACFWRFGRPVAGWRSVVYALAPALMAGGAVALWRVVSPAPASLALHLGGLALLATALTDPDFIPWPRRSKGRRSS